MYGFDRYDISDVVLVHEAMAQEVRVRPKENFSATMSMGLSTYEATMTVSEHGYQSASSDGHWHSSGLIPWGDVRRWSCNGEIYGFALTIHQQAAVDSFRFPHDDLVTIVDNYLKKYAGDELDPQEGCKPDS